MERDDVLPQVPGARRRQGEHQLVEDVVDLFMALSLAERGALFGRTSTGTLALEASRSLDQAALDLVHHEWARNSAELLTGTPTYRHLHQRSYLLLPCLDNGEMVGLLYIELSATGRRMPAAHLSAFAAILGRSLRMRQGRAGSLAYDESFGAPPDTDRENLLLQLERHEWNVSRVARLLGVTRMTIYNRMRRLKVPREHVRKSRPRRGR